MKKVEKPKKLALEELAWLMFLDTPVIDVVAYAEAIGYELTIVLPKWGRDGAKILTLMNLGFILRIGITRLDISGSWELTFLNGK